jgi:hypothetical protein
MSNYNNEGNGKSKRKGSKYVGKVKKSKKGKASVAK